MCKLAIENEPKYNIKICDFEIKHKIIGTTATVLKLFYKEYKNDNFFFIIGMDNANKIEQWVDYEITLKLIPFIVLNRIEYKIPINKWFLNKPHIFLNQTYNDLNYISSTNVRDIIKNTPLIELSINNNLKNYLYDNIIEYIIKYNLYRNKF